MISLSDDCTLRVWDLNKSENQCSLVMKFADPMTAAAYSIEKKLLFVGGWDRSVRAIDLVECRIVKHFVAAGDAINSVAIFENKLYVAGCDPVIRSFDLETGECKSYDGHKSWVNCLAFLVRPQDEEDEGEPQAFMYSAGDDRAIFVWDLQTGKHVESLTGHENSIVSLDFANGDL